MPAASSSGMSAVEDRIPGLAVLGCLTIDNVIGADGSLTRDVCAGNAIYAAIGARVWEPRVGIVGRIGTDYPSEGLTGFAAAGLDLAGLHRLGEPHALRVAFWYRPDGTRERVVPSEVLASMPAAARASFRDTTSDEEAYRRFSPHAADVPRAWLRAVRGVHLPALRLERQTYLARSLRRQRPDLVITCDSPGHEAFDLGTHRLRPLLETIDAILPGAEDIGRRGRDHDPAAVARRFIRLGAGSVILKLGSAGSLVLGADGSAWQVPAVPVALVDPTGAGDAFCGGFLAGLVATRDPLAAASWGSASASFAIEARRPRLEPIDPTEAIRRRDAVARAVTNLGHQEEERR